MKTSLGSAAKDIEYTCPMHPRVRQMGPGHCPICGGTGTAGPDLLVAALMAVLAPTGASSVLRHARLELRSVPSTR